MRSKRIFHIIFHNKILLTAIIILFIVIAAILVGLSLPKHQPTIEGQLESTDYRVSTKVPSRVVKLLVGEGDYVHEGDTLAILLGARGERPRTGYASQGASSRSRRSTDQ